METSLPLRSMYRVIVARIELLWNWSWMRCPKLTASFQQHEQKALLLSQIRGYLLFAHLVNLHSDSLQHLLWQVPCHPLFRSLHNLRHLTALHPSCSLSSVLIVFSYSGSFYLPTNTLLFSRRPFLPWRWRSSFLRIVGSHKTYTVKHAGRWHFHRPVTSFFTFPASLVPSLVTLILVSYLSQGRSCTGRPSKHGPAFVTDLRLILKHLLILCGMSYIRRK